MKAEYPGAPRLPVQLSGAGGLTPIFDYFGFLAESVRGVSFG